MSRAADLTRGLLRLPLTWTLVGLTLAVALHLAHLPPWVNATFGLLCAWRIVLAVRATRLPSRLLRVLILVLLLLAVLGTYRTLNGIDAGTTLLTLMAALKLLETRAARDHVVVLLISYFLVLAALLRSQSLLLVPLHVLAVWAITTALLRVTQSRATLSPAQLLRSSGRMLTQATPLALALFLFFPRIPGPFWALPAAERARSGLGDEMSPGEISDLTLSSDVAFRARFSGAAPPPAQRYWRGPVLHEFDGNRWRTARSFAALGGPVQYAGAAFDYTLMLEPSGRHWVFALDMAQQWPRRMYQSFDYQLLSSAPLDQALTVALTSHPSYAAGLELSHTLRRLDTHLPAGRNPRSHALALELRARAAGDEGLIGAVLELFRSQPFVYTLTPPKLDPDSVDDFFFNTRSGFCAHYASAFTMLMRAAGIPARVVTGYQGGEYNRMGDYWIVRQSDAHAWSEVWLAGRGWVRVDPTAAVAPERIERGAYEYAGARLPVADRLLREYSWLANLREAWDALNTAWRQRVLAFDARAQRDLLSALGFEKTDWETLAVILAASLAGFLAVLGLWLARELRWRETDPVARQWRRFERRLERRGITRAPHEGPLDFTRRLRRLHPQLTGEVDPIAELYLTLRYGAQARAGALDELARRVERFRA